MKGGWYLEVILSFGETDHFEPYFCKPDFGPKGLPLPFLKNCFFWTSDCLNKYFGVNGGKHKSYLFKNAFLWNLSRFQVSPHSAINCAGFMKNTKGSSNYCNLLVKFKSIFIPNSISEVIYSLCKSCQVESRWRGGLPNSKELQCVLITLPNLIHY